MNGSSVQESLVLLNNTKYHRLSRQEVTQFLPKRYTTVLEIGCGEGAFVTNLDQFCETWGVDLNMNATRKASERMNRVLTGQYKSVNNKLPDNYFDLIICNDVIEHMDDHDWFLESIKEKMKHNGYLVGSIPNVRYFKNLHRLLVKKDWKYREKGILDKTHKRFFTEKSLKRTFREHGFIIEYFKGINSAFGRKCCVESIYENSLILLTIIGTMGYFSDIRFQQFGFRVAIGK